MEDSFSKKIEDPNEETQFLDHYQSFMKNIYQPFMKDIGKIDTEKILKDHYQSFMKVFERRQEEARKLYREETQYTLKDKDLTEENKLQALLDSIRIAELRLKVEKEDRTPRAKYFKKLKAYFNFEDKTIQPQLDANTTSLDTARKFIVLLGEIDKNHVIPNGDRPHYSFVTEIILFFHWGRVWYLEIKKDIDAFKKLEKYGVQKEKYLEKNESQQFDLFSSIKLNGIGNFTYIYFQEQYNIDTTKCKKLFSMLLYAQDSYSRVGNGEQTSNLPKIPKQDHEFKFR